MLAGVSSGVEGAEEWIRTWWKAELGMLEIEVDDLG
jgi:hypothetical protein